MLGIKYNKFRQLSILLLLLISIGLTANQISFAQHEGHQRETQPAEKPKAKTEKSTAQKAIYYCPMHPSYTSDRPGDCPICNMKLVKKETAQKLEGSAVFINSEKQQLIGVKTDKAAFRSLDKTIRTVGRVAFDPELYQAQQEYIEAVKILEKFNENAQPEIIKRTEFLVEAAALKLELKGLSKKQIEELKEKRENDPSLLISSSDSAQAWVYATIYEYELDYVTIGQIASISAVSYPDRTFQGEVVAVDPVFDAMTRSVRARIKVDNPEGLLKPNMYVDVELISELGPKLLVPKEAVMDTGLRKIVFVALPDGYFQAREVKVGFSSDDYVEVTEGLKEEEIVVVSGNFLIDAESKLKAALEGVGHQHGQ